MPGSKKRGTRKLSEQKIDIPPSPPPPLPQLTSPKSSLSIDEEALNQKLSNQFIVPESVSSVISERVRKLLEYLVPYDSLYLCQTTHAFPDAVASQIHHRCVHKYEIKDYYGATQFYAVELTPRCNYFCCSHARSFRICVYDPTGTFLFESIRPCTASLCIVGVDSCYTGGVETTANHRNEENYIGSVMSQGNCVTPKYRVQNEFWDEQYQIQGPKYGNLFPCRLCFIHQFFICLPKTLTSVGKIVYGYDGLQEDRIPNPTTVGVIFPPRCSPEIKACLLTAGFMLDVTYFQNRGCTVYRILRYLFHFVFATAVVCGCFFIYFYATDT